MVKFLITSQSIKDITVQAVTINGLPFFTFEESGIAKMLAPMLDQLNLKPAASNVRVWITDAYQRKRIETKQTFFGKMVLVKVDLCKQRKRQFIGINMQAVVDDNFPVITAPVNELHERATASAIRKKKL